MVKILAPSLVNLGLTLLQMGIITSVLVPPTSAAVVPVHSQENESKVTGPVASSSFAKSHRSSPRYCSVVRVPEKNSHTKAKIEKRNGERKSLAQLLQEHQAFDLVFLVEELSESYYHDMIHTIEESGVLQNMDPEIRIQVRKRISEFKKNLDDTAAKARLSWWYDKLILGGCCVENSGDDAYISDLLEDYEVAAHYGLI
ncbi:hypothetical protein EV360DRAFT_88170 [Lentinula raphanica]|nr:hypothetical protein EV360DRAFT_88170 [Lentinula raphanica]